jgi:lysozyme
MTGMASPKTRPTLPATNPAPSPPITIPPQFVVNAAGLALAKYYEGLYLTASEDCVGVSTIGYGRILYDDGTHVKNGDTCTEDQANQWLLEDLNTDGAHYVRAWAKGLNQDQFSALTSFSFNRGAGRLRELLAMPGDIAANLLTFDFAGSPTNHLLGLQRRRRSEAALYQGLDWTIYKNWNPN